MTGLSREMIIHPGETVAELLEDRNMSQKELALRTGVTPKHISKVVNGQANISAVFAKRLEYAFGISADFWQNLQANYDRELQEYEEYHSVSQQELDLVQNHVDVVQRLIAEHLIESAEDQVVIVLHLRVFLRMSNLCDAEAIAACRREHQQNKITDAFLLLIDLRCKEKP